MKTSKELLIYDRLIVDVLIIFAAAYPLVANPFFAPVFTFPKLVFLRLTTIALLLIWSLKSLAGRRIELGKRAINLPLAALLLTTGLATVLSIDRTISLFGQYGRWEGLLTLICYLTLSLAAANFADHAGFRKLLKAFLVSAAVVSVLTVIETLWQNPFVAVAKVYCPAGFGTSETGIFGDLRPFASFGSPTNLAAFLAMMVPLALAVFLWESRDRTLKYLSSASGLLSLTALILTQARAGWLGAGLGVAIVLVVAAKQEIARKKLLPAAVGLILVITVTVIAYPGLINRAGTLTNPAQAIEGRLQMWQASVRVIAARPFFGWGPETFKLAFPKYKPAGWQLSYQNAQLDQAHNWLLQQTATNGLAGGLALLFFIGVLLRQTLSLFKIPEEFRLPVAGTAAGSLAYILQAQFNPTHISVAPLFWIFVGLTFSLSASGSGLNIKLSGSRNNFWVVLLVLSAVILSVGSLIPFIADVRFNKAMEWRLLGDRKKAVFLNEQATRIYPLESLYWQAQGEDYLKNWQETPAPLLLKKAGHAFERSIKLTPADPTAYFRAGSAFLEVARLTRDPSLFSRIIGYEKRGLALSPGVIDAYLDIGVVYAYRGEISLAIGYWKKAAALNPGDARPHLNLGWAYEKTGRPKAAVAEYRKAVALDPSLKEASRALDRIKRDALNLYHKR